MKNSRNYHDQVNIDNVQKLRTLQEQLPSFCRQFFRGIEPTTASRTRIAYAYDLGVFFEFLHTHNSVCRKMEITEFPLSLLDQIGREDIEEYLCSTFHLQRVLWLDNGYLSGDDTDSHIDTLARFCSPDTIAYVQCTDPEDEHYDALHLMEEQLKTFRTLKDTPYRLLPLPMPNAVVIDGERLPATYANFLIMNEAVLYPTYGQPENDARAHEVLQTAFPKHEIIGIDCQVLIRQHGSLHCVTMQYPAGVIA